MPANSTTSTPTFDHAPTTTADGVLAATSPTKPTNVPQHGSTMRAVVRHRYGAPDDVLGVADVARPAIDADQVLVEVAAAGLERGAWHVVTGLPYLMRLMGYGLTRPKQPIVGHEVAGRVVAVGSDVTRLAEGDRVFGIADGAFARFAVADADKLAHVPDGVAFDHAALSAISASTALEAVEDVAGVRPGQSVLVVGASGGVGTAAVQLAKAAGAIVTGVASGRKLDAVRAIGADHVVDYTMTDPFGTDQRYDVLLDIGGCTPVSRLRRVLRTDGTLVIVGGEGDGRWTGGVGRGARAVLASPFVSQRLTMFISTEHHTMLERVAAHLAAGTHVPVVDRRVGLDEVPAALDDLVAGRVTGKVAVIVDPDC